jgi:hypothetical protein
MRLDSELSANQQSMLDLALGCDLRVSDPAIHEAIKTRHRAIKTNRDAAAYIHEVENKIHSRRKFRRQVARHPVHIPAALGKPPP